MHRANFYTEFVKTADSGYERIRRIFALGSTRALHLEKLISPLQSLEFTALPPVSARYECLGMPKSGLDKRAWSWEDGGRRIVAFRKHPGAFVRFPFALHAASCEARVEQSAPQDDISAGLTDVKFRYSHSFV